MLDFTKVCAKSWSSKKAPWWKTSCAPCCTTTLASGARSLLGKTDIDDHPAAVGLGRTASIAGHAGTGPLAARHFRRWTVARGCPLSWHRSCSRTRPIRSATPYFCTGCPHNLSTRVPTGSGNRQALVAIPWRVGWTARPRSPGSHGRRGRGWVCTIVLHPTPPSLSRTWAMEPIRTQATWPFARQRQRAPTSPTKILYNDAVAMTGSQPWTVVFRYPKSRARCGPKASKRIAVVTSLTSNGTANNTYSTGHHVSRAHRAMPCNRDAHHAGGDGHLRSGVRHRATSTHQARHGSRAHHANIHSSRNSAKLRGLHGRFQLWQPSGRWLPPRDASARSTRLSAIGTSPVCRPPARPW